MILDTMQINQMNSIFDHHTTLNKIQLYKDSGASPFIIDILLKQLELGNNKKFGCMMEHLAKSLFNLDDSLNSEHDSVKNGFKIEQKTSTMSAPKLRMGKSQFQYNSIRMKYDYTHLMLCNINFTTIDFYLISKKKLHQLRELFLGQKRFRNDSIIEVLMFDVIKEHCIAINPENIDKVLSFSD